MRNQYTRVNFISFLLSSFSIISFIVFLSSTQSFFITDVLGISENVGNYVGTLAFYCEILTILLSPLFGALSDKYGTGLISSLGIFIMGGALMLLTFAHSIFPGMLIYRLIFAVGATASTSMISAMLTELTSSNFRISKFWNKQHTIHIDDINENTPFIESQEINLPVPSSRSGKLSALIGICSGLGAIFAVSVYLPMPIKFGEHLPASNALKDSYYVVGSIAILSSIILFLGLFNSLKNRSINLELTNLKYTQLIKRGFNEGLQNHQIMLAYTGSLVARSTTVATSLFIPFFLYNYYYKVGQCKSADKVNCYDGYKYAAILTGVAQSIGLILAPIWGIFSDKYGRKLSLVISSIIGMVSCLSLSFRENPHTPVFVLSIIFLGISEIGSIIVSMSLITDEQRLHSGSISGVYALFGGVGILILTKLGGLFADKWVGAPFFILSLFNFVLLTLSLYVIYTKRASASAL